MPRYFIEVAYKGTNYSGFQIQENANTIQAEIEKAFRILHGNNLLLTGSSRTDAGVHAVQNFFHFDLEENLNQRFVYKMNALLPKDVVVNRVVQMPFDAHCRFDATSREYRYHIHRLKNPFVQQTSFYFPYKLDFELMQQASEIVLQQTNFFAFSKTNTQVKTFNCKILRSEWLIEGDSFTYTIEANRFLRGMVRSITASLLKLGRHKIAIEQFQSLFTAEQKAGTSVPAHGLFLVGVKYPENYFPATGMSFTAF